MSAPLVPSPLDYIGRRRFAFYPAIRHPDPNEWLLGTGSWSEVQAVNAHTGREIWISRRYIGAVSESADPLLIVGLTETLDFRDDAFGARPARVIQMPAKRPPEMEGFETVRRSPGLAPVVAIRLESRTDTSLGRALMTSFVGAVVLALLAALTAAARL